MSATISAFGFRRAVGLSALAAAIGAGGLPSSVRAQAAKPEAGVEGDAGAGARGSIVEDRAARKLLEAGDARYEVDETTKAVEVWQSVIERYPRSRVRYEAHLRLGKFFLERDRSYDRARTHFQIVSEEANSDQDQRAEATLKVGVCFYEARNFGKCFGVMRDVIEQFPVGPQVNEAYYYIGLGHFQLGHYSRAIDALEKVGTALSGSKDKGGKVEAGKRLFVKIEDADLAAIEAGQTVAVTCRTTTGDEETLQAYPVGRNVRVVLGSVPTRLGRPQKGNGTLEVRGGDKVTVSYVDSHTADNAFDRKVVQEITVVGNAVAAVTDGAFSETLKGVVLGKPVNLQVVDADRDTTDGADTIEATIDVLRPKTDEEIESEKAKLIADGASPADNNGQGPLVDRYKKIDGVKVVLTEVKIVRRASSVPDMPMPAGDGAAPASDANAPAADKGAAAAGAAEPKAEGAAKGTENETPVDDGTIHSGVFQATITLERSETIVADDQLLQALTGDAIRLSYKDVLSLHDAERTVSSDAKCVDGNLGGVRVTRAVITDRELRIQTRLRTAGALTNIGNRYKEFGLKSHAEAKYQQALDVCEEIMSEARQLGGRLLEDTYVQLWHVYFEMDRLDLAAAMCQRLQREFPSSGFVDDALLQLAEVARKQGDLQRAIGIFSRLVNMPTSQLRGEAQFGIATCYEQMANDPKSTGGQVQNLDRAFQEYKKVYDQFPDSGRVGEAVSKMANYYYQQKDYARAVDTFETVLGSYPDAKFLDVILFNYGRCLYRMNRRDEARRRFDQLISEFPESPLATDAKKISEALAKSGPGAGG